MKKFISLSFAVLALMVAMATVSFAQQSGKCGDNLTWELNDGALRISGTGKMYNYDTKDEIPWLINNEESEIKTITIKSGVESICDLAFYQTAIEQLIIPDSVVEVGQAVAANCPNLKKIRLSENITVIPGAAFNTNELLTEINIPAKLTRIENDAFLYCKSLKKINLPDTLTYIGAQAFDSSGLEEVIIPEQITEIPNSMCDGCEDLKRIELPKNLKKIGMYAFSDCPDIKYIILPDGLEEVENSAFNKSNAQFVYIPKSVSKIGDDAFYRCETIYGYENSYAEEYAKENHEKFISVTESLYANGYQNYIQEEAPEVNKTYELTVKTVGDTIAVYADGEEIEFTDVMPFFDSADRTQMPVRAVAESLGCGVHYIDGLVIIQNGNDIINLTIGSDILMKNNEAIQMDTSAVIISDRTFVPVRFIAEALGYTVKWENAQ